MKDSSNFELIFRLIVIFVLQHFSLPADEIHIGPNFRIYPSLVTQTEIFITVHPHNPDILFASANTVLFSPFFISEGIYVSVDGGLSWFGSDTCNGEIINLHGGDPGIAIDKNGIFILTRLGQSPFFGLYSHFSIDEGLNWSNQNTITTDDLERAAVATDGDPASLFYGRSYAMWVRFAPPYPVYFSYTDDGASNWSSPSQVNNPPQRGAGGDAAVEMGGRVHLVWAGVSAVSPFTEELVGYAVSDDGGQTWNVKETAFPMNGIQGLLPQKQNIRVNGLPRIAVDNSGGSRQGWIYVVTTQKNLSPAGMDPDIILNRSSDGGQSWSAGIRVNQDALNNGKIQYFPAVTVDSNGGINIIYYDDRNTSSDSCSVFLSRSTDGGDSWQDFEISDHNFKPAPIGGLGQGYQGDNIDITVAGNTLWPVWMDNSSGIYQIWTVPVDLNTLGLAGQFTALPPESFLLDSVYPNPFNATTRINYTINHRGRVNLTIYDIKGKLLQTLVDREQGNGEYSILFNAENLSSGIYLIKLSLDEQTVSRPLILLK
jgi:hypothetical protein